MNELASQYHKIHRVIVLTLTNLSGLPFGKSQHGAEQHHGTEHLDSSLVTNYLMTAIQLLIYISISIIDYS